MSTDTPTLISFSPQTSGTLRGFARVRFPAFDGVEVEGISIHISGDRCWASPPGRPWIEGGELVRDPGTGKPKYSQVLYFANHGARSRWSDSVVALIRQHHPELFLEAASPLFGEGGGA
jgi:hypothetical protein